MGYGVGGLGRATRNPKPQSRSPKATMAHHNNSNRARLPLLGITMGDAAGIGPEVIARSLTDEKVRLRCRCIIYGDRDVFSSQLRDLQLEVPFRGVESPEEAAGLEVSLIHCSRLDMSGVDYGEMDARAAANAVAYIDRVTADALSSRIDAVVTAPINKVCPSGEQGFRWMGTPTTSPKSPA